METLFARHAPKRGRVVLMLAGSLVFHGGLVGIGALFVQPPPPQVEPWFPVPIDEGPAPISVPEPAVRPEVESVPTATPESIDATVSTPPPVSDDPIFAEPSTPTPRQRNVTKPTTAARTTTRATSSTAVQAGVGPSSAVNGGTPIAGAMSWIMPHPSFPAFARQSVTPGSTRLRITTDAAGRISNVVVEQSTGNPALDAYTVRCVRERWHGPANASRTTEFVYQLR